MSDKPAWWSVADRPTGRRTWTRLVGKEWDTTLALDDAVRAIHQRVQVLGLMSDTVIVFMTDNGVCVRRASLQREGLRV